MKEKRLDFELLRLIGIICVVFNHTQHRGFELYHIPGGSLVNGLVSMILAAWCKIGVPLFLMVSGGLLLHKNESLSVVLKKRVGRMLAALVLFSGVLYCFYTRWGIVEAPGILDFLRRLWGEGISNPYWYLYAYLGLMLMLPMLRPMAQGMKDETFVYLLGLHVVFQCILETVMVLGDFGAPFGTVRLSGWNTTVNFYLPVAEDILFYFLMGYYFSHRFCWEKIGGKQLGALWGLTVVSVLVMISLPLWDIICGHDSIDGILGNLICVPTIAVYITICVLVRKHPFGGKGAAWISALGGCTFGTYLLEGMLRHGLLGLYDYLEPIIHVLPACFVWVAAVLILGLVCTWGMKKIPGLRRIL